MSGATGTSAVERVRAGWRPEVPAWVLRLAEECDRTSQAAVARDIRYSAAVVSHVLRGPHVYKGDLAAVEAAVRGAFMAASVFCIGQNRDLPLNECNEWQRRRYDGSNHLNVTMFRACRGGQCPHSKAGGGDAE
jgi:hypothetical protein